MKAVMNTTVIRLSRNPVFAIRSRLIRPLANTMALGGVPIGSMNAQEAAIVAGSISRSALIFNASAVATNMGSNIWVDAVLDVTSVRKVIIRATVATKTGTGTL